MNAAEWKALEENCAAHPQPVEVYLYYKGRAAGGVENDQAFGIGVPEVWDALFDEDPADPATTKALQALVARANSVAGLLAEITRLQDEVSYKRAEINTIHAHCTAFHTQKGAAT